MASNLRQQSSAGTASRQIPAAANSHASGDLCYEAGMYGVAADDVQAGSSFRMYLDCIVFVPVPAATPIGTTVGSASSKPAGAITLAATPTVPMGITVTAVDANNYAEVQLFPALSVGK